MANPLSSPEVQEALKGGQETVTELIKGPALTPYQREERITRAKQALSIVKREMKDMHADEKLKVIRSTRAVMEEELAAVTVQLRGNADDKMEKLRQDIESVRTDSVEEEQKVNTLPQNAILESKEVVRDIAQGNWKTWVKYGAAFAGAGLFAKFLWDKTIGSGENPGFLRKAFGWLTAAGGAALGAIGLSKLMRQGVGSLKLGDVTDATIDAGMGAGGKVTQNAMEAGRLVKRDLEYWKNVFEQPDISGAMKYIFKEGGTVELAKDHLSLVLRMGTETFTLPASSVAKFAKWAMPGGKADEDIWIVYGESGAAYVMGQTGLNLIIRGKTALPLTKKDLVLTACKMMTGPGAALRDTAALLVTPFRTGGAEALQLRYLRQTAPVRGFNFAKGLLFGWYDLKSEKGLLKAVDTWKALQRDGEVMERFSKGGFHVFSDTEVQLAVRDRKILTDNLQKALSGIPEADLKSDLLKNLKSNSHLGIEYFEKEMDIAINEAKQATTAPKPPAPEKGTPAAAIEKSAAKKPINAAESERVIKSIGLEAEAKQGATIIRTEEKGKDILKVIAADGKTLRTLELKPAGPGFTGKGLIVLDGAFVVLDFLQYKSRVEFREEATKKIRETLLHTDKFALMSEAQKTGDKARFAGKETFIYKENPSIVVCIEDLTSSLNDKATAAGAKTAFSVASFITTSSLVLMESGVAAPVGLALAGIGLVVHTVTAGIDRAKAFQCVKDMPSWLLPLVGTDVVGENAHDLLEQSLYDAFIENNDKNARLKLLYAMWIKTVGADKELAQEVFPDLLDPKASAEFMQKEFSEIVLPFFTATVFLHTPYSHMKWSEIRDLQFNGIFFKSTSAQAIESSLLASARFYQQHTREKNFKTLFALQERVAQGTTLGEEDTEMLVRIGLQQVPATAGRAELEKAGRAQLPELLKKLGNQQVGPTTLGHEAQELRKNGDVTRWQILAGRLHAQIASRLQGGDGTLEDLVDRMQLTPEEATAAKRNQDEADARMRQSLQELANLKNKALVDLATGQPLVDGSDLLRFMPGGLFKNVKPTTTFGKAVTTVDETLTAIPRALISDMERPFRYKHALTLTPNVAGLPPQLTLLDLLKGTNQTADERTFEQAREQTRGMSVENPIVIDPHKGGVTVSRKGPQLYLRLPPGFAWTTVNAQGAHGEKIGFNEQGVCSIGKGIPKAFFWLDGADPAKTGFEVTINDN